MTSIQSIPIHHQPQLTQEEESQKSAAAASASPPRFEAFIMTGNVMLAKTNAQNGGSNHSSSSIGGRRGQKKVFTPSPTNNLVLHSPPLKPRKSASVSPASDGDQENKPNDYTPTQTEVRTFEFTGHDVHGFTLSTVVSHQQRSGLDIQVHPQPESLPPLEPVPPPEESTRLEEPPFVRDPRLDLSSSSLPGRSSTPETLDDRPVWTINAPVKTVNGAVLSGSLPGSPRRSGRRFREILKEETIITDTTISEVTDTNISTSYILPSPRTPRHLSKRTSAENPPPPVDGVADSGSSVGESVDEVVVVQADGLRPEETVVGEMERIEDAAPSRTRVKPFVHPDSAYDCMEIFPLDGMSLDQALRVFLSQVKLVGETQARQRVVDLFARRYVQCNRDGFYTPDSAYAVVSAMLILNSDLHSAHRPSKSMTASRFVANLREVAACRNLPQEELLSIFSSVKETPLPLPAGYQEPVPVEPLRDEPGQVIHSGFLIRKSDIDVGGNPTGFGRRGWHKFFCVLQDLLLHLYKKKPTGNSEVPALSIPVHHGYAVAATDYRKRPWVVRFRSVDQSVNLLQAASADDMAAWLTAVNRTAALYSAPVSLPVGSQTMAAGKQKRLSTVRPLYPFKKAHMTPDEQWEEARRTEERLLEEVEKINSRQPDSRNEALFMSSQLDFYQLELERCRVYLEILSRGS